MKKLGSYQQDKVKTPFYSKKHDFKKHEAQNAKKIRNM